MIATPMPNLNTTLPIPESDAKAHSDQLLQHILSEIRSHGPLSFERYMELALYAPGLGYYSSGTQKFGRQGDFITAPELSFLFSQSLARQCQQVLSTFPGADILEIGAGSGKMAADILLLLEKMNGLPNHYYILELSADLKKRQTETLAQLCPHLLPSIVWLNTLPTTFSGVILANELLDAMPMHLFQIQNNRMYDVNITENAGILAYTYTPTQDTVLLNFVNSLQLPNGYTSEINRLLPHWIASLSDLLKIGVIFLIDYGFPCAEYYHPDRKLGTLMCHYKHHAHTDPLRYPGLQDMTAHVDFTAIAIAASDNNLSVLGFCEQAAFLFGCGLLELAAKAPPTTEAERVMQNHAINTLTSPAEMGELFKVIALGRNWDLPLLGFSLKDRRYAL